MHCASCVGHVENGLKAVAGVKDASVNLANESATVEYDDRKADTDDLIAAVEKAGYKASTGEAHAAMSHGEHAHRGSPLQGTLLIVMSVLAVPVLILGMFMSGPPWSAWVQMILATVIQFTLGLPFYAGTFRALRRLRADMDTLVALGTSIAWGYSVYLTVQSLMESGQMGHVFFDTSAVILVLVGWGKVMESRARGDAAAAIRSLAELQPQTATLLDNGSEVEVPIDELRPGNQVLVKPGQRVPIDGIVVKGRSAVDQSIVTGESMPVDVKAGSTVIGGSLNQSGALQVRVTHTGKGTALARIVELVNDAQGSKANVQRLVDRVASVFVPVVILIAGLTLIGWGMGSGDWTRAIQYAVAVLIVACPCALGLATPTAIMVGTGLGAKHGVLIKNARALEQAGQITDVILDKTGTLTMGKPVVADFAALDESADQRMVLALAASVERYSEHPLGMAIVKRAKQEELTIEEADNFEKLPHGGVRGKVRGKMVTVGSMAVMRELNIVDLNRLGRRLEALKQMGHSIAIVAADDKAVGVIGLADQIKPNAPKVIARLYEMGLKVVLMTGDHLPAAQSVALEIGIADTINGVQAQVLPQDKQDKVRELQARGARVAMVGDGVNDAPALAAADLGIAMAGLGAQNKSRDEGPAGSHVAMDAGDIVLPGGDLEALPRAISLSRAMMKRIKVGLFGAFIYNVILIPVAAAGFLHPMFAAAAMAASSVTVVFNALYLRKSWQP
jgi:Cu+-exporting ATPase